MSSVAPEGLEHRLGGLAGPQQRRDEDLVELLAGHRRRQRLGLAPPELGERRVDDVQPVAHPLRLGVADQHQLHGERAYVYESPRRERVVSRPDGSLRVPLPQRSGVDGRRVDGRSALRRSAAPSTTRPARARDRNGLAVAGMVLRDRRRRHRRGSRSSPCSAPSPAIVGLALSIPALARSRRTGSRPRLRHRRHRHQRLRARASVSLGIVLTVVLVRAIERVRRPGAVRGPIDRRACIADGGEIVRHVARREPSATTSATYIRRVVELGRTTTESVAGRRRRRRRHGEFDGRVTVAARFDAASPTAASSTSTVPPPFGLDPDVFD